MNSILPLLQATQQASAGIRNLPAIQKAQLLNSLANGIEQSKELIMAENKKDLDLMDKSDPKYDRLLLNENRIQGLADSLREVALLPDPTGEVMLNKKLENGLNIKKIAVPMGVVGVIYESRPNVTVDVAALCLRSGNACVLKGGKEASFSNQCLVSLIHQALEEAGLAREVVLLLPVDRKFTEELLKATRFVDIIIPRGSDSLIQFVRQNSLIPTIETGAGVVHTYVEKTADLGKAKNIIINARVSRPSVCNSLDCAIIDEHILGDFLPLLIEDLKQWNVEVYADAPAFAVLKEAGYTNLLEARPEDFGREWLDYKISIKTVKGIDEALAHIQQHSSRHSEAILTENQALANQFLAEVDAAAVYHNASTRFTDGGQFGLGAEIGISTQKLHARGPFALEKLVTEKWVITGNGQVRW
ncbi:glutamate-5-semialdehyde dehydrogenase [Emticicia sp. 21SJ11W-3]|uniref:glutamate-5-semialdehyde dehydrogenase n=1 Tax=Emticicia sp. 21SJ11W-3 TaxID=2916755 RepID=UPI00209EC03F|nr:glutamate-5-semialdehyde dehydrogenase [Emticicia sp. 21SJ11W-3]UTA67489.1 glutamate-5-semialdehyde dehydrogenase [Emticicia sp. 21SJ11W-3]